MRHFEELERWTKEAAQGKGSLLDLFLFIGIVTAVTILWTRVIKRLID